MHMPRYPALFYEDGGEFHGHIRTLIRGIFLIVRASRALAAPKRIYRVHLHNYELPELKIFHILLPVLRQRRTSLICKSNDNAGNAPKRGHKCG